MTSLDNIYHHYVASVSDRQSELGELIGDSGWQFDMDEGALSFGSLKLSIQILGTVSESANTWLWAWANEASGIPSHLLVAAKRLQDYGQIHGIAEFVDPEISLASFDGHLLSVAAAGLLDAPAYYRGPYEGGALFMLITDDQVPSPDAPPLLRLITGFPRCLVSYPVGRHRDAFHGYAQTLGLATTDEGLFSTVVKIDDGSSATASFDQEGRLVDITSTLIDR